ncbi:hypothetical protein [Aeromonas rivipollensis]|uniref:hypothetical protein n=1 Tax=Aeromonas rivipollensis TaxID=948519 RepID=UPI001F2CF0B9|nr:hypothetical protein [Aeromonas rivipollensis]MCE9942738.1 hypothetical protein [Aeromonas rivipollensis]
MKLLVIISMFLSFFVSAKQDTFSKSELQGIYDNLNISTFRSSLMPKRTKDKIYLRQMELSNPVFFKNGFLIETSDWTYTFTIIEKKDKNRDGTLDYALCFSDKSTVGTYSSMQPMLISPLGVNGQFIALAFTVDGC